MSIFHKITLQNMKKSSTRTIVTIIGVILSAAMITAVATFGTSLMQFLANGAMAKTGDWHVAFVEVDSAFAWERAQEPGVLHTAAFENIGYATLEGGKSPGKPYLFIAGFGEETFDTLPVSLISGRLPETSEEVLVPSHVALKGGVRYAVGDTLSLAVGSRRFGDTTLSQHISNLAGVEKLIPETEKKYTVVGTYERPGFEEHAAPGYTLITRADTPNPAGSYSLFVTLANPRQAQAYASGIAGAENYVLNEDVLRFLGASDNKLFNALLFTAGGILVAIIMIGSIFLIYNAFNISLNERIRQFGILSSVGATPGQLRNSVLFEGFCIGALGIPLGVLAGIGRIGLVLPVVTRNFSTIISSSVPLTLSVSLPALIAAAAVSLVTILISAYLPAKKAASTPVMECIRQTGEIKTEAKDVKTSKLTQRVYGLEGTLALKNFKRNKRRYRSVVLSLVLSVVLFVAGSAFGSTLKQIAQRLTVEMDGDISFYTRDMGEEALFQLYDRLKTADGVYRSAYQANVTYPAETCDLPANFLEVYRASAGDTSTERTLTLPLEAQFIEDDMYYGFIESLGLPTEEYNGPEAKVLLLAINAGEHKTYFTGDTMDFTLASPSGEQAKTIRGTFVDNYPLDTLPRDADAPAPTYLFMMVAPCWLKPQFDALGTPAVQGLTFWSETPAQSMAQMQSMILEAGVPSGYTLLNLSTAVDLFRNMTFVVDVFTYVFVVMISLIAVANVFNTISTNIRLRRRELAMLRSVGMSDRDFQKMMNFECLFYGMRTLVFGLPIATLASWLIYKGLAGVERMDTLGYAIPWGSMAISAASVFLIVFITMLYATSKVKKENIIDALRDDMT